MHIPHRDQVIKSLEADIDAFNNVHIPQRDQVIKMLQIEVERLHNVEIERDSILRSRIWRYTEPGNVPVAVEIRRPASITSGR